MHRNKLEVITHLSDIGGEKRTSHPADGMRKAGCYDPIADSQGEWG